MSIKVQIYNPANTAAKFSNSHKVGIFLAETCARKMNPYVPMETGMLSQNYITEPFKVIYNQVYAHRQFHGLNFNFSKEMHPLATARWDMACQQAKSNEISREVTEYIRRFGI